MLLIKSNKPTIQPNGLLDNFFGKDFFTSFGLDFQMTTPGVNIYENEKGYSIEVAAPGFSKEELELKLEENVLSISATRKGEQETKEGKVIKKEFLYRDFKRTFTLPENAEANKIVAAYENGILKLDIPKRDIENGKVSKTITIS